MKGSIRLEAPAKLNLFLKVTGRRPDGYHELHTLFQKVSLFDRIELAAREGEPRVELCCPGSSLPTGPENLAYRAALLFLEETGGQLDITIRLEKHIPVGAGLGGGSSDAASVLKGLNVLASEPIDTHGLMALGLRLGADVPFFIHPAPSAIGTGIGEKLEAHPAMPWWYLVVWPGFAVSTRWAYSSFELTTHGRKTIFSPGQGLQASLWTNDLEQAVIERYPRISELKQALLDLGARAALMSGSGSAVFGVFETRDAALKAHRGLEPLAGSMDLERYVVKGL